MAEIYDINPLELTKKLVRCESVTPADDGAISLLERTLSELGFRCHRLKFEDKDTPPIENLYARWGKGQPHLAFAGHTDVVPVGDLEDWDHPPFEGVVKDDFIVGRGTSDMKGAIAAFVSASQKVISEANPKDFSLSFIITGDEEGPAINGTQKMLKWLEENNEIPDHCIVGEPTNPNKLGQTIKIGRRGSLNGRVSLLGKQGHVAYPHKAKNPIPEFMKLLSHLPQGELDQGTEEFSPTNLEITSIETDAKAFNVIPGKVSAIFNSRFNTNFSGKTLQEKIRSSLESSGIDHQLELFLKGESFLTEPGLLADCLKDAIKSKLGVEPEYSTSGGTSDARFIKDYCPLVEFGLVGATMHSKNERVAVQDIADLSDIYYLTIKNLVDQSS